MNCNSVPCLPAKIQEASLSSNRCWFLPLTDLSPSLRSGPALHAPVTRLPSAETWNGSTPTLTTTHAADDPHFPCMSPMALAYSCRATRLDRETAKEVVGCQLNVQERQEQDISYIYICVYMNSSSLLIGPRPVYTTTPLLSCLSYVYLYIYVLLLINYAMTSPCLVSFNSIASPRLCSLILQAAPGWIQRSCSSSNFCIYSCSRSTFWYF